MIMNDAQLHSFVVLYNKHVNPKYFFSIPSVAVFCNNSGKCAPIFSQSYTAVKQICEVYNAARGTANMPCHVLNLRSLIG